MRKTRSQLAVSRWTGRVVPVILIGTVAYATYVFVTRLCVQYLLFGTPQRRSAAIGFLITYFILLLPMACAYFRLLYVATVDPGYLPLGPSAQRRRDRGRTGPGPLTSELVGDGDQAHTAEQSSEKELPNHLNPDSPGLELFYSRDVFVCEQDGKPKYCSECGIWKPDRAHHCSDVGRCVKKMDHFCPWVGGVVAENSFKFFMQFVTYAWIYCLYVLVIMAVYLHNQLTTTGSFDSQFAAIIGIAGFFGFFTFGLSGSSAHFIVENLTTIENLSKKTKAWQLAIVLPRYSSPLPDPTGVRYQIPTVTYPLPVPPSTQQTQISDNATSQPRSQSSSETLIERDAKAVRNFAILRMEPGQNPWNVGRWRNFTSVMGESLMEWLLPIKRSPICMHASMESYYPVGCAVDNLRATYLSQFSAAVGVIANPAPVPYQEGRDMEMQELRDLNNDPGSAEPRH